MSEDLNPLVARYLDCLAVERGLARNTVDAYRRDLVGLVRRLAPRCTPERAEVRDLARVLGSLRAEGKSSRSVARWLVAVRGFFSYLVEEGIVESNPAAHLDSPRSWRSLPKVLSFEEVDALLAAPDEATPVGLRDRAMMEVLYATGLRVSELVGLRLRDLHLDAGFVRCIGKGSKERVIPLGAEAGAALQRYLAAGRPALLGERKSDSLFVNCRGGWFQLVD